MNKLRFLYKLQSLSPACITKQLFISRLCIFECIRSNVLECSKPMRGFIPDICKTLSTYGLSKYWSHYVQFSEFPDKQPWKCIMKDAVAAHMLGLNSLKLSQKPGTLHLLMYMFVYDLQHPSPLYHIAKSYTLSLDIYG